MRQRIRWKDETKTFSWAENQVEIKLEPLPKQDGVLFFSLEKLAVDVR